MSELTHTSNDFSSVEQADALIVASGAGNRLIDGHIDTGNQA